MFHVFTSHCGLCMREQGSPEFSQFLNLGESLEFFSDPEPKHIVETEVKARTERSEFFQVPEPRRKLEIWRKYEGIRCFALLVPRTTYFFIFPHISSYFLHISFLFSSYFPHNYFLHISTYIFILFLHIFSYFSSYFPHILSLSPIEGGGGVPADSQ